MRRGLGRTSLVVSWLIATGALAIGPSPAHADDPPPPPPLCTPGTNPIKGLKTTLKVVTFTFDDGPSKTQTPQVMAQFEARGLKATFFHITNGVPKNAALVADMVARGFEVGSHSRSHSYNSSKNVKEMGPSKTVIETATGVAPLFYRVPGLGWSKAVVKATLPNGLCAIDTNFIVGDWTSPRASAKTLCARFKKNLKPGSLVVLHDGGTSHKQTIQALPCILDWALAQGYQVLPLRDFLALAQTPDATIVRKKII